MLAFRGIPSARGCIAPWESFGTIVEIGFKIDSDCDSFGSRVCLVAVAVQRTFKLFDECNKIADIYTWDVANIVEELAMNEEHHRRRGDQLSGPDAVGHRAGEEH